MLQVTLLVLSALLGGLSAYQSHLGLRAWYGAMAVIFFGLFMAVLSDDGDRV